MSRPKYWWDGTIRKAMRLYHSNKLDARTIQGSVIRIGIGKALEETKTKPDGDLRLELLDLCYFKGGYTIDQGAYMVHVSPRTARTWTSEFVRMVGKNIGYL